MDKQLLKAYIRTIVEEEVSRILPQMLSEAVSEIKQLKENVTPPSRTAPKIDKWARFKGVDLERWASRYKGVRAKRSKWETGRDSLTYLIMSRGTRLHQSGRKSGTISESISDNALNQIIDTIYFEVTKRINFE
jgi:hypothetical protein